jgi:hypothetical protein
MKIRAYALIVPLTLCAHAAFGGCPERLQRDPLYVELAVDDKIPRPTSIDDFKFITDETTLDELKAKLGAPNAAKGASQFLWCLPDGTVMTVLSRDGSEIREVRAAGKLVYKRQKK